MNEHNEKNAQPGDVRYNQIVSSNPFLASIEEFLSTENLVQRLASSPLKDISIDSLSLFQNALTELPDQLWTLTALTSLNLGDNNIARLPDAISNLTSLRMLDLGHNRLAALPPYQTEQKYYQEELEQINIG